MLYNVVYETNIEADSPLEAAKIAEEIFLNKDGEAYRPQFYIEESERSNKKLYSVDLEEADEDAVYEVQNYSPLIKEFSKPLKRKS